MKFFGIEITGARIIGFAIIWMTVYGGIQVWSAVVTLTGRMAGM